MVSIKTIYSRAFAVLRKKPFLLWGISLLAMLLSALSVPLLGVIPAASIAVSMLLQTAMTLIYLRGYRGEEIAVTQLFDTFKDWKTVKRVLCGMGWASLWIFLWSLIPVVGIVFGIIRTYEYRLTPYILMHEPDVPITEAIKVSREKTRGYKAKMFGADALYVVVIAAAEILLALLATIPYIGVLFGILSVVFTIAPPCLGRCSSVWCRPPSMRRSRTAESARGAALSFLPTRVSAITAATAPMGTPAARRSSPPPLSARSAARR